MDMRPQSPGKTSPTQGQTMEETELSQLEKKNSILRAELESQRKLESDYKIQLLKAAIDLRKCKLEYMKSQQRYYNQPENGSHDEDSSTEEEGAVGEIDCDSIIVAEDKKCQEFLKEKKMKDMDDLLKKV